MQLISKRDREDLRELFRTRTVCCSHKIYCIEKKWGWCCWPLAPKRCERNRSHKWRNKNMRMRKERKGVYSHIYIWSFARNRLAVKQYEKTNSPVSLTMNADSWDYLEMNTETRNNAKGNCRRLSLGHISSHISIDDIDKVDNIVDKVKRCLRVESGYF